MKNYNVSRRAQQPNRYVRLVHNTGLLPLCSPLCIPRRTLGLLLMVVAMLGSQLPGAIEATEAQGTGRYVLVKTVVPEPKSSQGQDSRSSEKYSDRSYSYTYESFGDNGTPRVSRQVQWSWSAPPAQLAPGQKFNITVSGSAKDNDHDWGATRSELYVTEGISATVGVEVRADTKPSASRTVQLRAPDGPKAWWTRRIDDVRPLKDKFEVTIGAGTNATQYYYEWRGSTAPQKKKLTARLDCGTLEVVRNQNPETCHIIISGWRRNTADRVAVIFPRQSDGYGSQDKGGRTGIVVPIGRGSESVYNMSGSRGPDGSYGKSYSWTLLVRARGSAPIGTQSIPIIVRQKGAGEVKLTLRVRVVPGRSKQVGARRDGEGTVTGGTGTRPPITQATSGTGLSARLDTGALVLVPGQVSKTCTIFIRGWRTGTSDQVEVFLPQESKLRGNLGNDLVAFPGSSKVDPANMGRNSNGEYTFGMGFRAMERAPGVTTMIEIIVRQEGHEPVRLLLRVAVDAGRRNPGRVAAPATGGPGPSRPGPSRPVPSTTRPGANPGAQPGTSPAAISAANRQQANALHDQALQLADDGNLTQAIEKYRGALQLNPNLDECWNELGDLYRQQRKWADAEKSYREAVRRDPGESYYHAQLANALLKQGRRDEAMKEAQTAIRLGLEDHEVFDELGLTLSTVH